METIVVIFFIFIVWLIARLLIVPLIEKTLNGAIAKLNQYELKDYPEFMDAARKTVDYICNYFETVYIDEKNTNLEHIDYEVIIEFYHSKFTVDISYTKYGSYAYKVYYVEDRNHFEEHRKTFEFDDVELSSEGIESARRLISDLLKEKKVKAKRDNSGSLKINYTFNNPNYIRKPDKPVV